MMGCMSKAPALFLRKLFSKFLIQDFFFSKSSMLPFRFPLHRVLHSISDHSPVVADILIRESRQIQGKSQRSSVSTLNFR